VIDCQRDLFISGDFDRVVLLFTRGISDYQHDLFPVVTYQWRVFHSLEFRCTETVSELQQQQPTSKGRRGEGKGGKRRGERGRGRGKGGRGWPDQSQTRCYGSVSSAQHYSYA